MFRTDASDPAFQRLVRLLDAELADHNGDQHDFYNQFNTIDTIRHCVVLHNNEVPVACGAIKAFEPGVMEVKRMYVLPELRGAGLAARVLQALEEWAAELDHQACVLETSSGLRAAVRLYEKNGYRRIENYGQYIGVEGSICFKKDL